MRPSSLRPLRARPLHALLLLLVPLLVGGCSYLLGVRTEPPKLFVLSTTPAESPQALPPSVAVRARR